MHTLLQDLRYGLRMPAKSPGFTAAAVVSLTLGIRVNITIFHVRTAGDPKPMAAPVLREAQALDPNLPVEVRTMSEHMELSMWAPVMMGVVVGVFGIVPLALAMVGVYGVMSYSVSQRTHEFGIRAALGARQSEIVGLVLRKRLKITLAGLGIGLVFAVLLGRVLSDSLIGVKGFEPAIVVGVSAALAAVALLACYIPARRAARVDPAVALCYE